MGEASEPLVAPEPPIAVEPLVATVLLNWNGAEFTIPCLRSLQQQSYANQAFVVVDNGSRDDSVERLQREFGDKIALITIKDNGGFSAVCNLGIQRALELGADYVLVLNNDTILEEHCVRELVALAQSDPAIGIATAKILYYEPNDLIWFAGGDVRRGLLRFTARGLDEKDVGQFDTVCPSPFATGCCILVPRQVFLKIGAFDSRFFAYVEDSDFSMRVALAGYKLMYTPRAVLWHRVSATMKKNYHQSEFEKLSPEQHYYANRNRIWVVRKYGSAFEKLLSIAYLAARSLWRIPLFLLRKRGKSLVATWRGVIDGCRADLSDERAYFSHVGSPAGSE